jgi:hypothetical protein
MALAPQLGQGFGRYQLARAIVDHGARDLGNDTAPVDHRAVDLDRIRNARASTADQRAIAAVDDVETIGGDDVHPHAAAGVIDPVGQGNAAEVALELQRIALALRLIRAPLVHVAIDCAFCDRACRHECRSRCRRAEN